MAARSEEQEDRSCDDRSALTGSRTLELYTIADAASYVFDTAIEGLLDRPAPRRVAEAAIRSHTTAYRHEGIAGRRRALAARRAETGAKAAGPAG
jgi:hypothetical protein